MRMFLITITDDSDEIERVKKLDSVIEKAIRHALFKPIEEWKKVQVDEVKYPFNI